MANKECEKIRKLLPLYIDSVLSDKENDQVVQHLDKCPDCQYEYNYLKTIIKTATEIPQKELPSDFHKNLMEKVKSEARNKKKRYITLRHISAGVAAAAVIAISFVALGEIGEPEKIQLSDEYINSRLSDEPIQKDAGADMATDYLQTAEKKNTNRAESKSTDAPTDVVSQENMQTTQQIPATVNLDDEVMLYKTATVTLTEDNRDAVLEIISDFKKDETGYIIEDIESVIKKLKELGASVTIDNNSTNTHNYIVIK